MQSNLFETQKFIEGFEIHRQHLSLERQIKILDACRRVIASNPLWRPKFAGKNFVSEYALENTNCGKLGWLADEKGFRYSETDIQGNAFQPIPDEIMEVVKEFAPKGYRAENCLINFYQDREENGKPRKSKLGLHQDKTERDLSAPIISISIGQACIFQIGGLNQSDEVSEIEVRSGDVMIMAGKSRNAFHAVKKLIPKTCPSSLEMKTEARINITVRQVDRADEVKEFRKNAIVGLAELGEKKFDEKFIETTAKRNEFQKKHSASSVKDIENKFYDFSLRGRNDHPAKALTPEERNIYADYLESKGQPIAAETFRDYVEPPPPPKQKRRKKNEAENDAQSEETTFEFETDDQETF